MIKNIQLKDLKKSHPLKDNSKLNKIQKINFFKKVDNFIIEYFMKYKNSKYYPTKEVVDYLGKKYSISHNEISEIERPYTSSKLNSLRDRKIFQFIGKSLNIFTEYFTIGGRVYKVSFNINSTNKNKIKAKPIGSLNDIIKKI